MKIDIDSLPVAGERFSFLLEPDVVKVKARVYLGEDISFNFESTDPPCRNFLMIPVNAEGKKLKLTVKDVRGERIEAEYVIAASKVHSPTRL